MLLTAQSEKKGSVTKDKNPEDSFCTNDVNFSRLRGIVSVSMASSSTLNKLQ